LLNWGYTAFDAVRLFPAGAPVATPRVWKGKAPLVKLGQPDGVVVSVPAGEGGRLKTEIVRPDPLVAPLLQGQSVGMLRVSLASGALVTERPLTVLETVEESGVIGRAWDALRLWIQ
jgi:D-alanyl-D-alanine carboxypeptidase (penicillin-binding protein 5/6)